MDYIKFAKEQNIKFQEGIKRVEENRKKWENLKLRVEAYYKPLLKELKEHFKFEFFYLSFSEDYLEKKQSLNQNFIQISMGSHPVGIISNIKDAKTNEKSGIISEKGGTLSFSQGPQGEVMVLIYSCKSEVFKFEDDYIVYGIYKSPEKITKNRMSRIIKFYFKFMYITSIVGKSSTSDRLLINFVKMRGKFDLIKFGSSALKIFKGLLDTTFKANGLSK
ncbi:hypothetical protein ACNI3T_00400 [Christiangramia sp. ASW11-125]|uniref:hypothetical protein n=1 Tax=Christiangramia sp. ASW11-125 TaxID=3400701 RepID=UPI003AAB4E05